MFRLHSMAPWMERAKREACSLRREVEVRAVDSRDQWQEAALPSRDRARRNFPHEAAARFAAECEEVARP